MISSAILMAGAKRVLGFFFDDARGKAAAVVLLASAFAAWFAFENQTIGAARADAKGKSANAQGHSIGSAAARNSNRPGVAGGVLDPSTRWE